MKKVLQINPWVGGIQVCVKITDLLVVITYLINWQAKITSLYSYFWKHTYVKGLIRTVEYSYNTFPYLEILLLTFDIDEPWSSLLVFILTIFSIFGKGLAFLSSTINKHCSLDNKFCEKNIKQCHCWGLRTLNKSRLKVTKSISAFWPFNLSVLETAALK